MMSTENITQVWLLAGNDSFHALMVCVPARVQSFVGLHFFMGGVSIQTFAWLQNWYCGNQRSMLIPNCLFRMGGAAVLLSNKRMERLRAKCATPSPADL